MTAYMVDKDKLPWSFPTHRHEPRFWEWLGRVVGTYGFLELVLAKAIFSFTATRPYAPDEIEAAFEGWISKLEKALTDSLGPLIDQYENSVREHPNSDSESLATLLDHLRDAAQLRNVLCHGSWEAPDPKGGSVPFFVNRKHKQFATPIDRAFLEQTQLHVAELSCEVINSVTRMGLQFPGSSGPGAVI